MDNLQIIEQLTFPQIPCNCQFQDISQFINIQSHKEEEVFICENCVIQQNNSQQYLLIHRIIQSQQNDFFLNWPFLDDKELVQQIRYFSSYQNLYYQQNEQIETFFKEFSDEFVKALEQLKKITLKNQDQIFQDSSNLFEYYQNISQLADLKSVILDKESSKQQKSNKILKIITKKKKESPENTNKIKQMIEKINQYPQFNSEILSLNQLKQTTLSYINSMCNKQSNNNENKLEIKQNSNLDNILKLISNQSNFCNEKYLESVKNELLKIQDSVNILNIEKNVYLNGKQQINFDELSFNQIENIEILCNQISKLNNEYNQQKFNQDDEQSLFTKLQPSSNLILKNIAKLDSLISQEKKNKILEVMRNYPIFEIAQIVKQYSQQIEFEISNLSDSKQKMNAAYDNDGNMKFQVVKEGNCLSYVKIKKDCLYKLIIKLELKNQFFKHLCIGLVGQAHKDNKHIHDSNFINSFTPEGQHGDRGVSKIVKGKCLRNVKYPDEYNQIEITFCVKNKFFQVNDYPKKENINEINDDTLNLIDINQEYFLGFELYYLNDSITILDFQEIRQENNLLCK
ncbi:hypothetical protein ABPG74_019172 [Tetrahymena malaccensis]